MAALVRIVKLGGAVLTRDGCEGLFYWENVRRIVHELLPYCDSCLLIHGTGLVGKRPAVENEYFSTGRIPAANQRLAVGVRNSLRELNRRVLQVLLEAGVRALPMDTPQYFEEGGNGLRHSGLAASLAQATSRGLVPVFYGDLMPQSDGSFQVISSDAIMSVLVRALRPQETYMFTDVEGVYGGADGESGRNGAVIRTISESNIAQMRRSARDETDVSGGMGKKVEHALNIARSCGFCTIASGLVPGNVAKVLAGEDVICTRVVSDTQSRSR
ncbi:MAG: isopentenyl phosphate kinase [Verrucomicrobiota bacterium]